VFTGLVQEVGRVVEASPYDGGARIRIEAGCAAELSEGDSVLVNGVCLTATAPGRREFGADLTEETLARSSLGLLGAADYVNLELPLRPADRLGGHIVQGHVDGVGEVADVREAGLSREVRIATPAHLLRYVVEKGSVAVDGVSLTVARLNARDFEIMIIPHTLAATTLGGLARGKRVNLEMDMIGKYVQRMLQLREPPASMERPDGREGMTR
jgi:riboflavin synthase